jgi:predicted enzyme related to lactoylglutathione lyase
MSEGTVPEVGSIGWADLTVDDAARVRDFYRQVAGWAATEVDMGGYSDFVMHGAGAGRAVAGVCHARGANAGLPPVWLVYITVADLDASASRCVELGGRVVAPARVAGGGRFCVIEDPAGAVAALYEPALGAGA